MLVGLPWYRSMPYSSIVQLSLAVDGVPVEELQLEAAGGWADVPSLAAMTDRSWFLQDRRPLRWRPTGSLGERAEIVLRVGLHLPNLVGPTGGSVQVLQEVRGEVPVQAAA
jgi:hypothetical protein